MKTLLLIFCFGALEYLVFGSNFSLLRDQNIQRVHPKKNQAVIDKNLKLYRHNVKKPIIDIHGLSINTKKPGGHPQYTVFPPKNEVSGFSDLNKKHEKLYFSDDIAVDQVPPQRRVKKFPKQHIFSGVRKKRAAGKNEKKSLESDDQVTTLAKEVKEKTTKKEVNVNKTNIAAKKEKKKTTAVGGKITTVKVKDKKLIKEKKKSNKKQTKVISTKKGQSKKTISRSKGKESQGNNKKLNKKANEKGSSMKSKKDKRRQHPQETRRLIAARDAKIEDYPYVVSIQKNGEHWCAGALLNPRLVITTANCVWKANRMSRLRIRAGSRYANQGGQTARVAEVMKHPLWSIRGNEPNCDVALLLLDSNIRFSHTVHAVDLPNRHMAPPFGDAWVTSWGTERRDGIFEKKEMTLQVYHARLMDLTDCNNITTRFGVKVTNDFICLTQSERKAPCTRDTGAPAVSDGVLWGLASWGIRKLCGTERYPAMFSYIGSPNNMDFIINATTYLMSEERLYPYLGRYESQLGPSRRKKPQAKRRMVRTG